MRNGITFRVAPSLFAGRGGLIFGRVNAIWLILSNGEGKGGGEDE